MQPRDLKPEHFNKYPPLARRLVTDNIEVLRLLPLSILPPLLREAVEYDTKFPAERRNIERELRTLHGLSPDARSEWLNALSQIQISPALEKFDWVNQPAQFVEQLSAHLWSTHQQDAYRKAALDYGARLQAAAPAEKPAMPRLGISIIGQGVTTSELQLFRKLRPLGTYYPRVDTEGGLDQILAYAASRARQQDQAYAHWYIDAGQEAPFDSALTLVSYHALQAARAALSAKMEKEIEKPGMGPENLRTIMSRLKPADLGLDKISDAVLSHFQMKLLTEGSGTQIFSTTFAQWAARETLRRVQPLTLVVRFAPRQRQRPMNELIYGKKETLELDPEGSLLDGDMGAYYNWINQQRLSGAETASFVAWFEGHSQAVAIGPAVPRGTVSNTRVSLKQILEWTVS
jgi:hypothetical protein